MTPTKEMGTVNMNDVIIGVINKGSFHFPIEFEMFGEQQYVADATYDTGCSHSLISASSLNLGTKTIDDLKKELLYDINVNLFIGLGVESKGINISDIKRYVNKVNNLKQQLVNKGVPKDKAEEVLRKHITTEIETAILSSKMVRYEYLASSYKIDGVEIGDFKVRVSFNLKNVNLIGMHIIKELYTKIFSRNGKIFLLAKKNSELAEIDLDVALDELTEELELSDSIDDRALEANYINKRIQ